MLELSPIGWAIRPLQRYADFSGRAPRAEYWWYRLAAGVTGFILGLLDVLVFHGPIYGNYGFLGLTFIALTAIPGLAVFVRRLHDSGRSGWWALLGLPTFGFVLAGRAPIPGAAMFNGMPTALAIVFGIVWVIGGVVAFIFVVTPGTEGPNRYGPDPYGPDELEIVFA